MAILMSQWPFEEMLLVQETLIGGPNGIPAHSIDISFLAHKLPKDCDRFFKAKHTRDKVGWKGRSG